VEVREKMNETTIKVIHWIWGEPRLADFLREIAAGEKIPPHHEAFNFGDDQLACWISDFVFPEDRSRGIKAWIDLGGDETRVTELYEELTEGRKTPSGRTKWLDEMRADLVRDALLGHEGDSDIYVHVKIKGFAPGNRYRVHSKFGVYEAGFRGGTGFWTIAESDRQVCPMKIGERCSCEPVQRER
jgi:hypothetical protein